MQLGVPNAPSAGFEKGERGALTAKELRKGDWVKIGGGFVAVGVGDVVPGHGRAFHCVGREGVWFLDADTGREGFVGVVLEEKGKGKGRWIEER
jgi:hypothetical protein